MQYSKEQRIHIFAERVAIHGDNYSDAVRVAYPHSKKWTKHTVHVRASKFAKTDEVEIRINELRKLANKKIKAKFNKTLNDTLVELVNIGWFNPKDLINEDGSMRDVKDIPENTMRALAQVEYGQMNKVDGSGEITGNVTYITKYAPVNKNQALKQIMDYQIAEFDKPPEDDEFVEQDPVQLARRVISLIYAAKQKLDQIGIKHDRENQTSKNGKASSNAR